MSSGGAFEALAETTVSANTARFARVLALCINLNEPGRNEIVHNLYAHTAQHRIVLPRARPGRDPPRYPSRAHLFTGWEGKKVAHTHKRKLELYVGGLPCLAAAQSLASTAGSARSTGRKTAHGKGRVGLRILHPLPPNHAEGRRT